MTQLVARTPTLMSINNILLTKVPVWQGFSGRNRLNAQLGGGPGKIGAKAARFNDRDFARGIVQDDPIGL
jgi:hypothetical protein